MEINTGHLIMVRNHVVERLELALKQTGNFGYMLRSISMEVGI
jgi:hypothetical protein